MTITLYSLIGILIPFFGTTLGSFFVFFLHSNTDCKIQKLLLGFASGVMIAASIWSLLMPSVELAEKAGIISWFPASFGLALGIIFLMCIKHFTNAFDNKNMLMFSVTLHNIPEGMAVGVCFASFLIGNITLLEAFLLSIGIALQNIPEGAIISMPMRIKGNSKSKSFFYGVLSGVVEPVFSLITIILIRIMVPVLPYLLSFAAGAMLYVIVEELIPEMHSDDPSILGIIGFTFGFIIMMVLDISLS